MPHHSPSTDERWTGKPVNWILISEGSQRTHPQKSARPTSAHSATYPTFASRAHFAAHASQYNTTDVATRSDAIYPRATLPLSEIYYWAITYSSSIGFIIVVVLLTNLSQKYFKNWKTRDMRSTIFNLDLPNCGDIPRICLNYAVKLIDILSTPTWVVIFRRA